MLYCFVFENKLYVEPLLKDFRIGVTVSSIIGYMVNGSRKGLLQYARGTLRTGGGPWDFFETAQNFQERESQRHAGQRRGTLLLW